MNQRVSTGLAVGFFLAVLAVVLWLGLPNSQDTSFGDKVFVVTTIYPLADFAKNVGGEHVYIRNIVPAGAEPHEYEPTPREITQLLESDVLIYVGAGLDGWAEAAAPQAAETGAVVVAMEDVVTLTSLTAHEDDAGAAGEEQHDHDAVDPHAWLDLALSQDMVITIRDAFILADPSHANDYRANAEAYVKSLQALDVAYSATLASCQLNDIIVSHDAFGYLGRRYAFEIHPISGLSPEAEPSVRDLSELAREARALKVTTIFFETLVSPELAETLAKEVGAKTAVLNPLEGLSAAELAEGADYLSVMEANRQALSQAMLCQ